MPSGNYTSYYDQSDRPEFHYEYDEYYEEEYWCHECESQVIFMEGLCECCRNIRRVDLYGIPDSNNDYWLKSPCDIGQKLRQKVLNPLNIQPKTYSCPVVPPFYHPPSYDKVPLLVLKKSSIKKKAFY